MMYNNELFNLNWKEHMLNAAEAFRNLHTDASFADVTLATADGVQIQAHKNILSAISPFFRNILISNVHQHPLIYLKGIHSEALKYILSFVYLGSVQISQDKLDEFLDTAKELKVKGIADENKEERKNFMPMNDEPSTLDDKNISFNEDQNQEELYSNSLVPILEHQEENSYTKPMDFNRLAHCPHCDYRTESRSNLSRHLKQHAGVKYPCTWCDHQSTNTSNLKRHQKNTHGVN